MTYKSFERFLQRKFFPKKILLPLLISTFAQNFAQLVIMTDFEQLKQEAISRGMCDKFAGEWNEPDIETLCRFFHRGQDFCIEKDFPSIDTLSKYQGRIEQYGIYTKDGIADNQPYVVALGNADITVDVFDVTDLTVRHNAMVRLRLHGKCLCYVSAYNDCNVIVENKDNNSRLCMSYWGGTIENKDMFDKITDKR